MNNMNINRYRQSQFELFPGASGSHRDSGKKDRLIKDLTLSLENISVLGIIFVMILVLFFSFGVERGKKIAMGSNVPENDQFVPVGENIAEEKQTSVGQTPVEEKLAIPTDVPNEEETISQPPLEKNEEQEQLFTIQVASFKLKKNAEKEAEHLKGLGLEDAFVVPKGTYSIVCIGKFLERDEAKVFSNRLKNRYNDCLVRRL
jgi:hypothetical protein